MLEWIETPKSSNTKRIGYDAEKKTLVCDFHRSRMYLYKEVPQEKWEALKVAPSVGKYLAEFIIPIYSWVYYHEEETEQAAS